MQRWSVRHLFCLFARFTWPMVRTHSSLSQANQASSGYDLSAGRTRNLFSQHRQDRSMIWSACLGMGAYNYLAAANSRKNVCWGYLANRLPRGRRWVPALWRAIALHAWFIAPPSGAQNIGWCRRAERVRLSIGGVIMDDLLRRNRGPLIIKPSVPSVFWVPFAAGLNFELRSDGVCHTTTGAGLCVTVRLLTVIRPLKAFKPSFVRPIGPITTRDSGLSAGNSQRRRDQDGRARPCGSRIG